MSDAQEVLVVAVSTVGGPALGGAVLERHRSGKAHFHVVVPERLPNHGFTWTTAQVEHDAEKRLSLILGLMEDMGVDVDGEVTRESDVADVVDLALEERDVDEVLVVQGAPGLKKLVDKRRTKRLDKQTEVTITQFEPDDAGDEGDYDPDLWESTLRDWAKAIDDSPESG